MLKNIIFCRGRQNLYLVNYTSDYYQVSRRPFEHCQRFSDQDPFLISRRRSNRPPRPLRGALILSSRRALCGHRETVVPATLALAPSARIFNILEIRLSLKFRYCERSTIHALLATAALEICADRRIRERSIAISASHDTFAVFPRILYRSHRQRGQVRAAWLTYIHRKEFYFAV